MLPKAMLCDPHVLSFCSYSHVGACCPFVLQTMTVALHVPPKRAEPAFWINAFWRKLAQDFRRLVASSSGIHMPRLESLWKLVPLGQVPVLWGFAVCNKLNAIETKVFPCRSVGDSSQVSHLFLGAPGTLGIAAFACAADYSCSQSRSC